MPDADVSSLLKLSTSLQATGRSPLHAVRSYLLTLFCLTQLPAERPFGSRLQKSVPSECGPFNRFSLEPVPVHRAQGKPASPRRSAACLPGPGGPSASSRSPAAPAAAAGDHLPPRSEPPPRRLPTSISESAERYDAGASAATARLLGSVRPSAVGSGLGPRAASAGEGGTNTASKDGGRGEPTPRR